MKGMENERRLPVRLDRDRKLTERHPVRRGPEMGGQRGLDAFPVCGIHRPGQRHVETEFVEHVGVTPVGEMRKLALG